MFNKVVLFSLFVIICIFIWSMVCCGHGQKKTRHQDLLKVNVVKSSKELQDFAAKYKSSDIVIASAHSFGNRPAIWTHIPRDYFSVVVVDKGHHARAPTWKMPIRHFRGATKVFLTATPSRTDCRPLYAKLVFSYKLLQACRDGKAKNTKATCKQ